jgi:hypothetical protein
MTNNIRTIHNEVVPLATDRKEIADALRTCADELEAGRLGDVLHACVLMDNGKQLLTMHRATAHTTKLEWLGLLHLAQHMTLTR